VAARDLALGEVLRREGVDVRAVTVWSLLGAFDWNSLVTKEAGFYEPGPFDVRSPTPRPTALAALSRQLARGDAPERILHDHPVLEQPGWWRRPDRLFYPTAEGRSFQRAFHAAAGGGADMRDRSARPLVVTGVTGTLGSAFARLCDVRGIPYHALTRQEVELTDPDAVEAAVARLRPWAVVNCAGWVRVDDAERDEAACMRANVDAPAALAAACARHGARLVAFSSDLVFGGADYGGPRAHPYVESDAPTPLGVYGRSKAEMEQRVLGALPDALVVRTAAFFGPWDAHNFVTAALRALAAGEPFEAADDQTVSPTYVVDLVHATLDLLIDGERGVWHLANRGAVTWADLARLAAGHAGVSAGDVIGRPARELGSAARDRGTAPSAPNGARCCPRSTTRSRATCATARWPTPSARPAVRSGGATSARGATGKWRGGSEEGGPSGQARGPASRTPAVATTRITRCGRPQPAGAALAGVGTAGPRWWPPPQRAFRDAAG
jgi:dTDP-4-dehydrorhamnose reductase